MNGSLLVGGSAYMMERKEENKAEKERKETRTKEQRKAVLLKS